MKRRNSKRINKMPGKDSLIKTATNAILLSSMIRDIVRQELMRFYLIQGEEIDL